jgi:MFS family permease
MSEQSGIAMLARVGRARELRLVMVAFAGFSIAEHATWLAVLFYALERGGANDVGLVAFLQLIPVVVITPFASYAGDRFRPQRALAAGYAAQSAAMVVVALAMLGDNSLIVYTASALAAVGVSFTRPVMSSLLPTLTHTPNDLIAANVVASTIQQFGLLGGPLLAGAVMMSGTPAGVFATCAVMTGLGCVAVLRTPVHDDEQDEAPKFGALAHHLVAGFITLRKESRVRVLVALSSVAGLVNGIGDVLFVTVADERLDGGGGQAGLLAAAYGLGGMLAVTAGTRLVRNQRVGRSFLISGVLAGGALAGLSTTAGVGGVLLLFAVLGAGEALIRVIAAVALQRQSPIEVLARVFGIVEGAQMAAIALGGLVVAIMFNQFGVTESFIALGITVIAFCGLGVARLRAAGAGPAPVDDATIGRLAIDPVFAMLPSPMMERLGRTTRTQHVSAGVEVVVQGDEGDHYYAITAGEFTVVRDGVVANRLGPGQSFGEIALLRNVPRTSTVTAVSDAELLVIDRDDFLEAVTGHPRSLTAAHTIADGHLDRSDP